MPRYGRPPGGGFVGPGGPGRHGRRNLSHRNRFSQRARREAVLAGQQAIQPKAVLIRWHGQQSHVLHGHWCDDPAHFLRRHLNLIFEKYNALLMSRLVLHLIL